MSHVLSPATEARVLQQVATGRSTAPDDLLNHAPADTPAHERPRRRHHLRNRRRA